MSRRLVISAATRPVEGWPWKRATMAKPVTNHELDVLLVEAGYGTAHAALARQVNRLGRERHGLALRYDGASVYWWLRGRSPGSPVPELVAAVLSRRLGRTVLTDQLGFAEVSPALARLGLDFAPHIEDSVSVVTDLWRYLVLRRKFLVDAPFVTMAATEAGWRWHFDARDHDTSRTGGRKVTASDVAVLRASQHQFLDLDRRYGGGHARAFLAEYLNREVAPLLLGSYSDTVGRELFTAVAELTAQVAFMSYDIGDQGVAQRHFIQALRLAKAADNHTFGAHILANMSTQAVFLSQPGEAVRLSRAAVEGARRRAPAGVMARLYTAEACAHAVAADPSSCSAALQHAERALDRSDPSSEPKWATYFTAAHLAGTAVRCFRDLGHHARALRHADDALHLSDASVRTRALHTALVASVHAEANEPEQASRLGHEALTLAASVRSTRVTRRIHDLSDRLAPHHRVPQVAAYRRRAQAHL